jgi:hypothetical protein
MRACRVGSLASWPRQVLWLLTSAVAEGGRGGQDRGPDMWEAAVARLAGRPLSELVYNAALEVSTTWALTT